MIQVACVGDVHDCPVHGRNMIVQGGSGRIDGRVVARVGDACACGCVIVTGASKAIMDGRPVAVLGSQTSSGGVITACLGTAMVG